MQMALVMVCAVATDNEKATTSVMVERVQLLAPSDVQKVRRVLKQLITMAVQMPGGTKRQAAPTWSQETSPAKAAKCRELGRWPTGESMPEEFVADASRAGV